MAKKIRFPLKMKNGEEVRTLDELKENFDLETVLGYFIDGKLQTWLSDRYYDEKAKAVSVLSADMPDLNAKLCEILEVEYKEETDETNVELIARRRKKLQIISTITDNRVILDSIDFVAMNQDELFDILDESPENIYLYGEKFSIPFVKKNICYIGINSPLVILEKGKYPYEYNEAGIRFTGVTYEENINPFITLGEKLFVVGHYRDAYFHIERAAKNGNPRTMYFMGLYYYWGYNTVHIDINVRNNWFRRGYEFGDPLATFWYAKLCVKDGSDEQIRLYHSIFEKVKNIADFGDNFAQHTIGFIYSNGCGVEKNIDKAFDYYKTSAEQGNAFSQSHFGYIYDSEEKDCNKAVEWYRKSAEQGCALGEYNYGLRFIIGRGVTQDYSKAFEWVSKAAEQGYAAAQNFLGYMYYDGECVTQDYSKAFEWVSKAAEQGYAAAQNFLGCMYYDGECVTQDYSKAVKWIKKAAEQGYAAAQYSIGEMYEEIKADKHLAIEWYKKAAAQDYEDAQERLNELGIYTW